MKLEFVFWEGNIANIICSFTDPNDDLQHFDSVYNTLYAQGINGIVNGEERYSHVYNENLQVIVAKKDNTRKLIIQDNYCLNLESLATIKEYLVEQQLLTMIDANNCDQLVKVVQDIINKSKDLNQQLNRLQMSLNEQAASTFEEVNFNNLQSESILLNQLLLKCKKIFDVIKMHAHSKIDTLADFINKDGLKIAVDNHLENNIKKINEIAFKLNEYSLFLESFIKTRSAYLDSNNKFKNVINGIKPVKETHLLESLIINQEIPIRKFTITISTKIGIPDIRRITLISKNAKDNADAALNALIELADKDNQKSFFQLQKNMLSLGELHDLFIKYGCTVDFSSVNRGKGELGMKFFDNLNGYDYKIEQDYVNIHREIRREIETLITKDAAQPIEITFIGCGIGEEIVKVAEFLEKNKIKFMIYGFDISSASIKTAQQDPRFAGKPIYFKQGDGNHFDDIIKEFRHEFNNGIAPSKSITVASGFLTRLVNKDSVEAFEIFKKIAYYTQTIIISGRTSTLITRRDAKKAGMRISNRLYFSGDHTRTLDRYEIEDIQQQVDRILLNQSNNKTIKIQNDVVIDLKDHARPMMIIDALIDKKAIDLHQCKLDLRNAFIDTNDKTQLSKLMQLILEYHVTITASGSENWYSSLKQIDPKLVRNIEIKPNQFTTIVDLEHDPVRVVSERPKVSEHMLERAQSEISCQYRR